MNDYPFTEKFIKDNMFLREFKEDTNESNLFGIKTKRNVFLRS